MNLKTWFIAVVSILLSYSVWVDPMLAGQSGASTIDVDLSRRSFIIEMITPGATEKTAQFDDYTTGSYHVDKLDLIAGVQELRNHGQQRIEAVIVVGPSFPLWRYNVVTVVSSEEHPNKIRVNHLVFPHARITNKYTHTITPASYQSKLDQILTIPALQEFAEESQLEDFEQKVFAVIVKLGDSDSIYFLPESLYEMDKVQIDRFFEVLNELIGGDKATITYSLDSEESQ